MRIFRFLVFPFLFSSSLGLSLPTSTRVNKRQGFRDQLMLNLELENARDSLVNSILGMNPPGVPAAPAPSELVIGGLRPPPPPPEGLVAPVVSSFQQQFSGGSSSDQGNSIIFPSNIFTISNSNANAGLGNGNEVALPLSQSYAYVISRPSSSSSETNYAVPETSYGSPQPNYGAPPETSYGTPPESNYGPPPQIPDTNYGITPVVVAYGPPETDYGTPSTTPKPPTGYGTPEDDTKTSTTTKGGRGSLSSSLLDKSILIAMEVMESAMDFKELKRKFIRGNFRRTQRLLGNRDTLLRPAKELASLGRNLFSELRKDIRQMRQKHGEYAAASTNTESNTESNSTSKSPQLSEFLNFLDTEMKKAVGAAGDDKEEEEESEGPNKDRPTGSASNLQGSTAIANNNETDATAPSGDEENSEEEPVVSNMNITSTEDATIDITTTLPSISEDNEVVEQIMNNTDNSMNPKDKESMSLMLMKMMEMMMNSTSTESSNSSISSSSTTTPTSTITSTISTASTSTTTEPPTTTTTENSTTSTPTTSTSTTRAPMSIEELFGLLAIASGRR